MASTDRFESLLADYAATRDDLRQTRVVASTTLAVGVAVVGFLSAIVIDPDQPLSDGFLAIALALPVIFLAVMQVQGTQSVIYSYYLRLLEREIRKDLGNGETDFYSGHEVKMPLVAFGEIDATSGGFTNPGERVLLSLVFGGGLFVYCGLAVAAIRQMEATPWKLIAGAFVATVLIVLATETRRALFRGRELFAEVAELAARRASEPLDSRPPSPRGSQRSLLSYLILPRPDDLVKSVFFIAFWGVGVFVEGQRIDRSSLISMIALVTVLELLIYQARYQWNDIRGYKQDLASPTAQERGRLPDTPGSIGASIYVIALRLLLVLIAWSADFQFSYMIMWLLILVSVNAVLYELSRTLEVQGRFRKLALVGVISSVGFGYVIRGVAGYYYSGAPASPYAWTSLGIYLYTFGLMFVSLTWVLEAASYSPDTVDPIGIKGGRSLQIRCRRDINRKPHLVWHLRSAGYSVSSLIAEQMKGAGGRTSRPLDLGSRFKAIWNWMMLMAAVSGQAMVLLLLKSQTEWWMTVFWMLSALVLGILLSRSTSLPQRLSVTGAGTLALTVELLFFGLASKTVVLGVLAWVAVAAVYTWFCSATYQGTRNTFKGFVDVTGGLSARGYAWVLGEAADEGLVRKYPADRARQRPD